MGFLKFLKRKRIEEDLLDIPPLPPLTEEGEDLGLASLPEPEIPPPPSEFLVSTKTGLPEIEDISLISTSPQPKYLKQHIIEEKHTPGLEEPIARDKSAKQKETISLETKKSRFVNLMRYKKILDQLSLSKSDARLADERILAVNQSNELKDRHVAKLKSTFEDIQKKLIIIDKLLSG